MKKLLLVIMALATLMYACAYADDTAATPTDLECEHNNAQWKTVYDWDNAVYQQVEYDSVNHTVFLTVTEIYHCDDCNQDVITNVFDNFQMSQLHHFVNGVCTECGYVNYCTHETKFQTYFFYDNKEVTYTPLDDREHTVSGKGYLCWRCFNCAEVWPIPGDSDILTFTAPHEFNEDGSCMTCGYAKPKDEHGRQPVQNKPGNQAADNSVKEQKTASLLPVEEYDEATGQVMKTLEDCVNTKNLSEVLPEEVCEKLNKAGSMLITPQAAAFENIPDNEETVTVIFQSEEDQEAGRDVVVLLGTIQEEEWKWYAYEGKTLEDNTISFTIPREELTAFGDSPVILSVLAAEQTPEQ